MATKRLLCWVVLIALVLPDETWSRPGGGRIGGGARGGGAARGGGGGRGRGVVVVPVGGRPRSNRANDEGDGDNDGADAAKTIGFIILGVLVLGGIFS